MGVGRLRGGLRMRGRGSERGEDGKGDGGRVGLGVMGEAGGLLGKSALQAVTGGRQ